MIFLEASGKIAWVGLLPARAHLLVELPGESYVRVWLLVGWFHIILSLHFVSAVLIPSMYPQYLHIFTHTSLRTVFCASFFVSFDSASVQNVHEHFLQCEDGFVMTAMAMTEPRICLSTHAPFTPFLEHVKTCP